MIKFPLDAIIHHHDRQQKRDCTEFNVKIVTNEIEAEIIETQ